MKTGLRIQALLIGFLIAAAAQADVRVDAARHSNITFRGDDVVISAADDSEARVTPAGDLYIRDKAVAVDAEQRRLLRQYYGGLKDIEQRGLAIGEHAVNMVGSMLGTLVTSLLVDGDDKDLDHRMKDKAEPLKDEARALCKDVQAERAVQDKISGEIPAFRPYAVIDTDSEHDCHVDDNHIEVLSRA